MICNSSLWYPSSHNHGSVENGLLKGDKPVIFQATILPSNPSPPKTKSPAPAPAAAPVGFQTFQNRWNVGKTGWSGVDLALVLPGDWWIFVSRGFRKFLGRGLIQIGGQGFAGDWWFFVSRVFWEAGDWFRLTLEGLGHHIFIGFSVPNHHYFDSGLSSPKRTQHSFNGGWLPGLTCPLKRDHFNNREIISSNHHLYGTRYQFGVPKGAEILPNLFSKEKMPRRCSFFFWFHARGWLFSWTKNPSWKKRIFFVVVVFRTTRIISISGYHCSWNRCFQGRVSFQGTSHESQPCGIPFPGGFFCHGLVDLLPTQDASHWR